MLSKTVFGLLCLTCVSAMIPSMFDVPLQHVNSRVSADQGKLVFLQAVWRHGDRAPEYQFPSDTNDWSDIGLGQLTVTGMEDHLTLGDKLRTRYINALGFVGSRYRYDEIYIRSTDVNRTLISALSNMIGFYSTNTANVDYPNATHWPRNFVPIPVHTEQRSTDYIGNVDRDCKRSGALRKLLKETEKYKKLESDNNEFFETVAKIANMSKVDLSNLWMISDDVFITQKYNKSLPDGFTDDVIEKIYDIADETDKALYGMGYGTYKGVDLSIEIPKVKGGPLLWSLIDHMQEKVSCIENKNDKNCHWLNPLKYHVYSAHDTTLSGLFSTFGFNQTDYNKKGLPDYASAFTIELWENDGNYTVTVLYWPPKDKENFQDITHLISGCEEICDLDTFVKRSEIYNTVNPEQLCNDDQFPPQDNSGSMASISVLLMFLAAFISLLN
ncbi:unnamed protein product [Bursaphelenchus okinawaensis]|uniref:acid phosphatase n=1 Tax=Bursaphelenchus okinawaensis TaxID=465554 RepID=A0A811K1F8_9BILA|nr:unnamed protein product [Bursaphelenchus okinawaensis]CAG9089732.1 unnamed protein product [Bursaphelenchus okinawaensis]